VIPLEVRQVSPVLVNRSTVFEKMQVLVLVFERLLGWNQGCEVNHEDIPGVAWSRRGSKKIICFQFADVIAMLSVCGFVVFVDVLTYHW
jgi:hypothetical protein